jgi:hypothetical protein
VLLSLADGKKLHRWNDDAHIVVFLETRLPTVPRRSADSHMFMMLACKTTGSSQLSHFPFPDLWSLLIILIFCTKRSNMLKKLAISIRFTLGQLNEMLSFLWNSYE